MNKKGVVLLFVTLSTFLPLAIEAWGGSSGGNSREKVLLEKVTAITLEEGKKTNARRTSAIPQLDCVGGSAGCYSYRPKVVQCTNVGFDGYDVQWECKAELDSKYRFGRIEVSCEGYDYPDDPYVLRGSCGLKYELDLTEEGHREKRGSFNQGGHHQQHHYNNDSGSGFFGSLISLLIIGAIIFCCLGTCFGSRNRGGTSYSSGGGYSSSSYGGNGYRSTHSSGPGFWTGAATGGTLGYLFGSRGNRRSYGGSGWGSSGSGWGSSGSGSSRSSSSSSSRTSSGFGGTSRR